MAYQHGMDVIVALKVEATYNTAPGSSAAEQLRIKASPGMTLEKALINSAEVRSDGQTSIARHGSRKATGSYDVELSVDTFDTVLEAVMRSTWVAAVAITQATMTSITTTTSTIVAAGGSWITQGVRVGDVVRLTNHSTAANNSINLRVATLTASTITTVGTPLTLDGTPDSSFTLTVLRKVSAAAVPTRRTFYIDEYNTGTDLSQVYGGCRIVGLSIRGTPDGMAEATITVVGASGTSLTTGTSPYFVSPTLTTTIPLVFADANIAYNGTDVATCTAFELNYTVAADTQPVIGASVSPDVFDNSATLTGSVSFVREDLTRATQFVNETELSLHVLLVEPESEPKDCISIFVGFLKLTAETAQLGSDGALIETLPWTAGVRPTTSGYDASLMTISTSAS